MEGGQPMGCEAIGFQLILFKPIGKDDVLVTLLHVDAKTFPTNPI